MSTNILMQQNTKFGYDALFPQTVSGLIEANGPNSQNTAKTLGGNTNLEHQLDFLAQSNKYSWLKYGPRGSGYYAESFEVYGTIATSSPNITCSGAESYRVTENGEIELINATNYSFTVTIRLDEGSYYCSPYSMFEYVRKPYIKWNNKIYTTSKEGYHNCLEFIGTSNNSLRIQAPTSGNYRCSEIVARKSNLNIHSYAYVNDYVTNTYGQETESGKKIGDYSYWYRNMPFNVLNHFPHIIQGEYIGTGVDYINLTAPWPIIAIFVAKITRRDSTDIIPTSDAVSIIVSTPTLTASLGNTNNSANILYKYLLICA